MEWNTWEEDSGRPNTRAGGEEEEGEEESVGAGWVGRKLEGRAERSLESNETEEDSELRKAARGGERKDGLWRAEEKRNVRAEGMAWDGTAVLAGAGGAIRSCSNSRCRSMAHANMAAALYAMLCWRQSERLPDSR